MEMSNMTCTYRLPSASNLDTNAVCTGQCVLPRIGSVGVPATRGTVAHKYIELWHDSPDAARAYANDWPQFGEYLLRIDVDGILGAFDIRQMESQYWYNPVDGTCGQSEDPTIRDNPNLFYGRCDAIGYTRSGVPCVVDWKTGKRWQTAKQKLQLKFFAMIFSKMTNVPNVHASYVYIEEGGGFEFDDVLLEPMDHAQTECELKDIHSSVVWNAQQVTQGNQPTLTKGDHCTFCPSYAHCPAQIKLIQSLVQHAGSAGDALDCLELSSAWELMAQAKMAVTKIEDQIKNYIRTTNASITLSNGKTVECRKNRIMPYNPQ